MKISLTQISISDRVNAAKTSPSATDTSSIPTTLNPSPGNSNIQPIDATGINKAGSDINAQTQIGNRATSDNARKGQSQEASKLQYDKTTISADDQPGTTTDPTQTPQPKSKGFRESLIDAQMANTMSNNTGGDKGSIDSDFGHDNGNPNEQVKKAPEAQPIKRQQMEPYNNSKNIVGEPRQFPIKSFEETPNVPKHSKIPQTTVKWNTPKINKPKFN